jgi:hypothetical protein
MHVLPSQQLYFQQLWPLANCDAKDGKLVGQLLVDLVETKPDDLAHAIRTFANRMTMLRECGFPMGEFLVALMSAQTQSEPQIVGAVMTDHISVTAEQASAIGRSLASALRQPPATATAVRRAVDLVMHTMRSRYIWFLPMLEVLLVQGAERRRSTIARRLSSLVTPGPGPEAIMEETLIHVAPSAEGAYVGLFASVVQLVLHPPVARGLLYQYRFAAAVIRVPWCHDRL